MTMTYTFDVFSSLDGFGSYDTNRGNWGGYWGKQGPELLEDDPAGPPGQDPARAGDALCYAIVDGTCPALIARSGPVLKSQTAPSRPSVKRA